MDFRLKGHVAIVQGASRGLGRGIAESLAAEGCDLLLTARNEKPLEKTAREIAAASGRRILHHPADSGDLAAVPDIVEHARRSFGRLDILVCNSGGPPPGGFAALTPEQWRAANDLLVVSPVILLQEALPLLKVSPAPRFFVVTSSSSRQPIPGLTLSNTYRPGLLGLIKSLAEELAADRIRCHSLAPGRFDTDRLKHLIDTQAASGGVTPQVIRERMLASIPAGRLGEPSDLGALVAFLCSPQADYLTGQNWLVDGGLIRTI